MILVILILLFFGLGLVLGLIWRWRIGLLFVTVPTISCLGSLYVADNSWLAGPLNDASQLLWILLHYAVALGATIGTGRFCGGSVPGGSGLTNGNC